tara:strand:- start:563 stop:769 length:207 start_codon:yes stop_codon:yes gene_type:complete
MAFRITKDFSLATFKVGKSVEQDGYYVCVPCGYKKYLKVGDTFPNCIKCMKKERELFKRGLELWERSK